MNILRPLSPHLYSILLRIRRYIPLLMLATIVLFSYILCLKIGLISDFLSWLWKVGFLLGSRALSFVFIKLGCSGVLAWTVVFAVRAFLTGFLTNNMEFNVGSVASTSDRPEWERGSSGSETGVNQEPQHINAVGPSAPANPAAPADPYEPLLSDAIRREELASRLRINTIGRDLQVQDSIVETQFKIDQMMERALLSDGYSRDSLYENRHKIRAFVFYPTGAAFSEATYTKYLGSMENHGTHRSLPYKRLIEAIYQKEIFLSLKIKEGL